LTTHSAARSNTALFRIGTVHAAHLPTVEDAARTPPRLPRAQSHTRRASGAAQPARARAPTRRAVAVVAAPGKRFGLDASRRLRRKAQFEQLLRQGERRSLGGYLFYVGRGAAQAPRLGILISRRHAAAAVERNRIKRCIREAFRLEQENLGNLELLIRPPYGIRGSPKMIRQLRELLRRLVA
jgi:ribonuclease P protein component